MSTLREVRAAAKTMSSAINKFHHASTMLDKSPDSEGARGWMEKCRSEYFTALETHTRVSGAWLDAVDATDAENLKQGVPPVIPETLHWV